eukprot:TRINITY_DN1935_c0_g1_i4.p1 TRINITY_DN1935_c0_g1~~TRINITY_DN1935_c0_g1_i4.p1  ORF type:complete len:146 (-),score=9.45 TRINITY_DN1935_c0_g1_i4:120-557(-)
MQSTQLTRHAAVVLLSSLTQLTVIWILDLFIIKLNDSNRHSDTCAEQPLVQLTSICPADLVSHKRSNIGAAGRPGRIPRPSAPHTGSSFFSLFQAAVSRGTIMCSDFAPICSLFSRAVERLTDHLEVASAPVSYTHLTLPTIYSV